MEKETGTRDLAPGKKTQWFVATLPLLSFAIPALPIIPILLWILIIIALGMLFFGWAMLLAAILSLFDISDVPYFYVKNPAPYNIPAVNEPYERDFQDDVTGFVEGHGEFSFGLLSNIQFYSENQVFLSSIKIPTSVLNVGTLRIREGKLYSSTKGEDFRYSFRSPSWNVGIPAETAKEYEKEYASVFWKKWPSLKFLYEKPGDSESTKNLRVDRIPSAYGVKFIRTNSELGYEIRFYLDFASPGAVEMLGRIRDGAAREYAYSKIFYEKGDGSISQAFWEVGNRYWNKTVTRDFKDYTETYAIPEMEKIPGREEAKTEFRRIASCIAKYPFQDGAAEGCKPSDIARIQSLAELSNGIWNGKNVNAIAGWQPKYFCASDWLRVPYLRAYDDSTPGTEPVCRDTRMEISPNPFLMSIATIFGEDNISWLDYISDFKENFGNTAAYSIEQLVDWTIKPGRTGTQKKEYAEVYIEYAAKFFRNGTLKTNFEKYWNSWVFYLYPKNVEQYGIAKFAFWNPHASEVTERYPKDGKDIVAISVYSYYATVVIGDFGISELTKAIDPGASKAFRKEFLLTPTSYGPEGKFSQGRIEAFKDKVLACQYPSCSLDESFGRGKTEIPDGDARASYFYLFQSSDGLFRQMVQKGVKTAFADSWKSVLANFSGYGNLEVSKFFNSYAMLANDAAIVSDFEKAVTWTERNPLEFLAYYRDKEFDLSEMLGDSGVARGSALRAEIEQDRNYSKYRDFFHEFIPYLASKEGLGQQEVIDGGICSKRKFSDPEKCLSAFSFLREAWNSDRSAGYYSAYSKFDGFMKEYSATGTLAVPTENAIPTPSPTDTSTWVLTGTGN